MSKMSLMDQTTHRCLDARFFTAPGSDLHTHQSRLERFPSTSLEQMGEASLMDRMETKYVFHRDQIHQILHGLEIEYKILEINQKRIFSYRTVYYDTADFSFFRQHQKGSGHRWKIRQRAYLDSNANYLEIKYKDNRKRTSKNRVQIDLEPALTLKNEDFFLKAYSPYDQSELIPKLEVWYTRATLVKNDGLERVTIDSQLYYSNGQSSFGFDGLIVAEIKQAEYDPSSPFMNHLKKEGVRPSPFSKYCIGISLLYPATKHNRFKPVIHHVSNLLGGDIANERTQ